MQRLSMTTTGRQGIKRVGLIVISVFLLTGYYLAFNPLKAKAAACTPPTTDYGSATASIKIDTTATYQIWSRMAPGSNTDNNSYMLEIDGNSCYVVGDAGLQAAPAWTWVDFQNGTASSKVRQSLSAGNHTIKMIGREEGVKVARVLFVSDLNCVPTDNGDNCAVAGDLEAPTVNITTPAANATVANNVNVTASATDNVGVTKVEFYVNGALKSTDTSAPYAYDWDSKTVANGSVSLMAKAYDAAGNTSSSTVQAKVANGDTTAPSVPTNLTAKADSSTKVTLNWTASTDNVAVAGYRIARNGVTIGQVTTGTTYTDNTVLPNMTYNYQVSAYDAAGNNSALSAVAQATTPNQLDTTAPSTPANVTATAASPTQVNISWTASTDNVAVAGYEVYRSVGGGTAVKVATVSTTSYGDTGLAASTEYTYYVIALDAASNASGPSATSAATTLASQPQQTTGKGKIYGRITMEGGRQTSGRVVMTINGTRRIYRTDSRGYYYIVNVPAGTYQVTYEADGYFSKTITVGVTAGKDTIQDVRLRRR